MEPKKLPTDFTYLPEMYSDQYYPANLVDKVRDVLKATVTYLEGGVRTPEEIQGAFDQAMVKINDLQDEFDENDSEIETVARDSIGETVERILNHFGIDMDIEELMRERDW